jgi:hypothetical protein
MSHQEKSNIISLVTTVIVTIPYLAFIFLKYQGESLDVTGQISFWATAILLLIPVRIVSEIIIYILISILTAIVTNKEEIDFTDERDKLIELKGGRNSSYMFIFGFALAMVAAASGNAVSVMFMILIVSGFLAEVLGSISQIYYYRKGV